MQLRKRLTILAAFGCRLLYVRPLPPSPLSRLTRSHSLIPLIAIRLVYLSPAENENPTMTTIVPYILAEAALEFAILSTSITALKPFLRPLHSGAVVSSVGGYGANVSNPYSRSQGKSQGIYMLSSVSGKDNKEDFETTTTHADEPRVSTTIQAPKAVFRPDLSAGETTTSVQSEVHRDDIESVESNSSEQMIIRTTRNWSVRYEDK